MARLVQPRLYLGLAALPCLAACGESSPDATSAVGPGGGAANAGGSGSGAAAASVGEATGGSTTSVVPTGGAWSTSGGASSGVVPTSIGGSASGGVSTTANTGGIAATTGGSMGTTGGASAGGTAAAMGGTTQTVGTGGATQTAGTGGVVVTTGGTTGTAGTGGTSATGGSAGTGGVSAGDTVCGTAEEGASVTLTCPEGQIIDSVVFASYGTPTGECGSFAIGDCHSDTSESAVTSICVDRRSCTLGAANGVFGDPCNSTAKSLAVEVACVEGEPTVEETPFKGVANSPANEIAELGATWCYNWTASPSASDCSDPYFVPMVWGGGNVAATIQRIADAGYTTVLGFNEPNKADQANMTVADAIAQWPGMTSNPNLRVSSPAVSDDGRAWLEDFMTQVQANGLRVDFIAMHWYGWNAGSCVASQLEAAIRWAEQWGLPVWITEWGCMGSSNSDEQTVLSFFQDAVALIPNHPLVERYAWYPWNTYNHLYLPDENEVRVITALGEAFAAAPQYR